MPLRKIKDYETPCLSQDHEPPMHIVLQPGEYEHECSSCHKKKKFSVPMIAV